MTPIIAGGAVVIVGALFLLLGGGGGGGGGGGFYSLEATTVQGKPVDMAGMAGKVVLVTNVASF